MAKFQSKGVTKFLSLYFNKINEMRKIEHIGIAGKENPIENRDLLEKRKKI